MLPTKYHFQMLFVNRFYSTPLHPSPGRIVQQRPGSVILTLP